MIPGTCVFTTVSDTSLLTFTFIRCLYVHTCMMSIYPSPSFKEKPWSIPINILIKILNAGNLSLWLSIIKKTCIICNKWSGAQMFGANLK